MLGGFLLRPAVPQGNEDLQNQSLDEDRIARVDPIPEPQDQLCLVVCSRSRQRSIGDSSSSSDSVAAFTCAIAPLPAASLSKGDKLRELAEDVVSTRSGFSAKSF
jgi:hypothetical protein